jgi:hypothetical protein
MKLTSEVKKIIDKKTPLELLYGIRYFPIGTDILQGESGEYWLKKYAAWRNQNTNQHVINSKKIGWETVPIKIFPL